MPFSSTSLEGQNYLEAYIWSILFQVEAELTSNGCLGASDDASSVADSYYAALNDQNNATVNPCLPLDTDEVMLLNHDFDSCYLHFFFAIFST